MALYEHEDAATRELTLSGVLEVYPTFSDDWYDDIRDLQVIVTAPVSVLMPSFDRLQASRDPSSVYDELERFGEMLCRAAWRCQRRREADEVIVMGDSEFSAYYWPTSPEPQLFVVGRAIPKIVGQHLLRFEVVQRSDTGRSFVIASGEHTMSIHRPPPEPPVAPAPIPIAAPELAPQVDPVLEPIAVPPPAPEVVPVLEPLVAQPPAPEVPAPEPEAIDEPRPAPEVDEDVPMDPVIRERSPEGIARPNHRFNPFQVPLRRRESFERAHQRERQNYRFSYVNARERHPQVARSLRRALTTLHIHGPIDIRSESMPTNVPDRHIFSFRVQTRQDAERIERIMIREGGDRFKLDSLEVSEPFFSTELSLRQVTKAIVLSHRYLEQLGAGEVFDLVDDNEHLANALADRAAMDEVRERFSRRGRGELAEMRAAVERE